MEANRVRDARKASELEQLGWSVITVWQCETTDEAALAAKILPLVEGKMRSTPR